MLHAALTGSSLEAPPFQAVLLQSSIPLLPLFLNLSPDSYVTEGRYVVVSRTGCQLSLSEGEVVFKKKSLNSPSSMRILYYYVQRVAWEEKIPLKPQSNLKSWVSPRGHRICHRLSKGAGLLARHRNSGLASTGAPGFPRESVLRRMASAFCLQRSRLGPPRASLQPEHSVEEEHNSRVLAKSGWHVSNYINESLSYKI